MKFCSFHILTVIMAVGVGVVCMILYMPSRPQLVELRNDFVQEQTCSKDISVERISDELPETQSIVSQEPEALSVQHKKIPESVDPAAPAPVSPAPPLPQLTENKPVDLSQSLHQKQQTNYKAIANHFNRQQQRLSHENNPNKRLNLIRSMAQYVRVDTPAAIDWAMSLKNEDEQRAALEAINEYALIGIGARIEMGESGIPKIEYTTVLGALESSGMIKNGDYIESMTSSDGSIINFKGLTIKEISNLLRGELGTELELKIRREADDVIPYTFFVPIQRSMIVVQPSYVWRSDSSQ